MFAIFGCWAGSAVGVRGLGGFGTVVFRGGFGVYGMVLVLV